jgi:hypothetical protein
MDGRRIDMILVQRQVEHWPELPTNVVLTASLINAVMSPRIGC